VAIKKIPKNTLVFHLKEKLFLIRPHGGDSLSYTLSEIKNAKQSHVLSGPFAHTKNGQKKSFGSEPFFRINERGEISYMTWVTKEEGLTIARIKKPGDWEVVSQYEEISRPAVFVEAPGTEKTDYIYTFYASGSATLSVARLGLERKQFKEIGPVARLVKGTEYGPLTVLRAERVAEGILIFYTSVNGWGFPMVDALLVDKDEPTEVLWRSPEPLWEAPLSMPLIAPVPVAIVHSQNKLFLYAENHDGGIDVLSLPKIRIKLFPQKKTPRELSDKSTIKKKHRTLTSVELTRYAGNPLLEPVSDNHWEAFAAFNPAALHIDGRVHLLYRAQGHDGLSTLGYASSSDGVSMEERLEYPVFVPSRKFDTRTKRADKSPYPYVSGGGYGGCEDPRLILIEETIYLIYVAFDGERPPGVALSSISKSDFLAKEWTWTVPRLISEPGKIQKNWVLFPEKINGKFAILHGISPKVQVEYVDSLDELGMNGKYVESLRSHGGHGYEEEERKKHWDNIVRGAGAPPIYTPHGWLVFYHAMDFRDPGKYKVGAMLLDLNNPEKVLHRAKRPVLEPETYYENHGHKRGVVYVCGAVVKDDVLFVYYGASDKTVAVAAVSFPEFLADLIADKMPVLNRLTYDNNRYSLTK
jgi:beta-1,2-mannobiose phosphorylase / 1,2-beta-oligomannan phosphorylase